MSIIALIAILALLGVAAWFVNSSGKISGTIKWWINAVIITIAVLITLTAFGVWDEVRSIKVPKL